MLPQKYFLERISGDMVPVRPLVEDMASLDHFTFTPEHAAKLNDADLFFTIGADFEQHLAPKIQADYPKLKSVRTPFGIELFDYDPALPYLGDAIPPSDSVKDPLLWTSPPLVRVVGENMLNALVDYEPSGERLYNSGFKLFEREIDDMSDKIRAVLKNIDTPYFLTSHPDWNYFAKTYGLKPVSVHVNGNPPNEEQLAALLRFAVEHKIKVFLCRNGESEIVDYIEKTLDIEATKIDLMSYYWADTLDKAVTAFWRVYK